MRRSPGLRDHGGHWPLATAFFPSPLSLSKKAQIAIQPRTHLLRIAWYSSLHEMTDINSGLSPLEAQN